MIIWIVQFLLVISVGFEVEANEDAKRLFDDLLRNYNKLRRPVRNPLDKVRIKLKLRLSQIIDVHEKDQIMTTSVWLKQEWEDYKLSWEAAEYGGVDVLYVPAEMIWVPDIVLYNNADSNYNITITTKATVRSSGVVEWEPPAVYKSMCQIDVEWFPFDVQHCKLKFGSWTYDVRLLDLQHMDESAVIEEVKGHNESVVMQGIDLHEYYPSVEWEILEIPARRHNRHYQSCCPDSDSYVDITYYLTLRRKPLFYTVNLIFPCVGISFLTILVFYLPSDSGEKITLSISILVSLTVFFLLLTEIIPATSIVLPLIGKYLLFTMVMVSLSVIVTVVVLNLHFRTPTTHRMPRWVKRVFLQILPKYLFMKRPMSEDESFRRVSSKSYTFEVPVSADEQASPSAVRGTGSFNDRTNPTDPVVHLNANSDHHNLDGSGGAPRAGKLSRSGSQRSSGKKSSSPFLSVPPDADMRQHRQELEALYRSPPVLQAFENVCFIAELLKKQDKDDRIDEDWKYVAMVLDRLFLWLFSLACFFGTVAILLEAPTFYDKRTPVEGSERGIN